MEALLGLCQCPEPSLIDVLYAVTLSLPIGLIVVPIASKVIERSLRNAKAGTPET